ncbi:hypothetical protein N9X25_10275, partial [Verrucomicrobiales bacterium]|nr:hypothetical protein [Verrucomicrobiales bacterium]
DNQGREEMPHPFYDCSHITVWTSRLHLGEGVAAKRESEVTVEKGIDLLVPFLKRRPEMTDRLLTLAAKLDEELPEIVPDATTLQAAYTRRHQGVTTPDELAKRISSVVNEIFPREQFAEEYTTANGSFGVEMPKKGLRVRIAIGGLAAAYLSELANRGTKWIEENKDLVYRPGEAKRKRKAQNKAVRALLPRCQERLDTHNIAVFG